MYFLQMDGSRYKITFVYPPYLLIVPREGQSLEVARFLNKKYAGVMQKLEHTHKEDLDLANHLSGKKLEVLQMWFPNNNAMMKVRRELLAAVKRNKERTQTNTTYMQMLSNSLANASNVAKVDAGENPLDLIVDIRGNF